MDCLILFIMLDVSLKFYFDYLFFRVILYLKVSFIYMNILNFINLVVYFGFDFFKIKVIIRIIIFKGI